MGHLRTVLFSVLLVSFLNINRASEEALNESTTANATLDNFNCPVECHCNRVTHTRSQQAFLHARCNNSDAIDTDSFRNASLPIHSLDLSYLSLSRLPHNLDKLHNLTSIDLSHNELHELGHLGRRIKKLNLKHNHITSGKLMKLPHHVQSLNLQHNDITYLPLEFMKFNQLQTLELSHNQINCSCETLQVRNWLQDQHVFMENAVKCSYPSEVKGQPWLQVRQSDICENEKRSADWYANDEDNELMLGDQPFEASGDANDEEELGKDYMPIDSKTSSPKLAELQAGTDSEGSGDLSDALDSAVSTTSSSHLMENTDSGDDEGSGSGDGFIPISIGNDDSDSDEFGSPIKSKISNDNKFDMSPMQEPLPDATPSPDEFGAGLGIFDTSNSASTEGPHAVNEEPIVPAVQHNLGANDSDGDVDSTSTDGPMDASIMKAEAGDTKDSNATYFLLGVISLIVVGLILFVAIKRCKHHSSDRYDPENPRQTELLDMDKKNLGKPLQRPENAPLIGEKSKADMAKPMNGSNKKPYDSNDTKDGTTQQQPLLKNGKPDTNGSTPKDAVEDAVDKATANELSAPPHPGSYEYHPITPRYPTPKSPRASKYAQYPQNEPNNNNNEYMPASPKSGRYSPVYSPETGRVKIKLTETPRPKTPMLVTRSRSNAGEMITTPAEHQQQQTSDMLRNANSNGTVPVHTGPNGHVH